MNKIKLGRSGVEAPQIGLGCMRIAGLSAAQGEKLIRTAMENGINFFDHADIYGGGECESAMAAVLKLSDKAVEELCANFPDVYPVNYNCPGQLVVAGGRDHLDRFCELAAQAGGRAKKLAVGGGFHSPFMEEASAAFRKELDRAGVGMPRIPVYGNRTAAPYSEEREAMLAEQMKNPVLWTKTIERMAADGVDTFIEVGPGKTLSGLVKRILPQAVVCRVEDAATLEETLRTLQETGGQE